MKKVLLGAWLALAGLCLRWRPRRHPAPGFVLDDYVARQLSNGVVPGAAAATEVQGGFTRVQDAGER